MLKYQCADYCMLIWDDEHTDYLLWQIDAMERYEKVLARRARAEKINLSPWDKKGNVYA